jgi:hypothetical protein
MFQTVYFNFFKVSDKLCSHFLPLRVVRVLPFYKKKKKKLFCVCFSSAQVPRKINARYNSGEQKDMYPWMGPCERTSRSAPRHQRRAPPFGSRRLHGSSSDFLSTTHAMALP